MAIEKVGRLQRVKYSYILENTCDHSIMIRMDITYAIFLFKHRARLKCSHSWREKCSQHFSFLFEESAVLIEEAIIRCENKLI